MNEKATGKSERERDKPGDSRATCFPMPVVGRSRERERRECVRERNGKRKKYMPILSSSSSASRRWDERGRKRGKGEKRRTISKRGGTTTRRGRARGLAGDLIKRDVLFATKRERGTLLRAHISARRLTRRRHDGFAKMRRGE